MKTRPQYEVDSHPDSVSAPAHAATASYMVMLVDDHPMIRDGLTCLIQTQPDLNVTLQAGSPAEAISLLSKHSPDLIITDLSMPGRGGIEFIKDLHALAPSTPILVLSMHDELLFAQRSLRAGARGYLMKDAGATRVLDAIRQILAGNIVVSPQMSARLLNDIAGVKSKSPSSPIEQLSDREFEIFRLFGRGLSSKDIATELHLSPKTVDVHRQRIKQKLHLKHANTLVHFAANWLAAQSAGAA